MISKKGFQAYQFVMRYFSYSILLFLFLVMASADAFAKFKDLTPIADAQVVEGYSDNNYGSSTSLYLQSANSKYKDERIWLCFDLTDQIPTDAVITAATLRLYAFTADKDNDLIVDVHSCSDDTWKENTITWDNQPAYDSLLSTVTLKSHREYLWYEFNVTRFVVAEFRGDRRISLLVKPKIESASQRISYTFNSREYLKKGYALIPRLRIEFSGNWPTTNSINVIHTNDMHSRLTTHDLDFPDADGVNPGMEKAGGAAYLASKVAALKKADVNSLVLNAGDISEGNPLGDLRGNGGIVDFFQTLNTQLKAMASNTSGRGVDAILAGNHDVREAAMLNNMMDPDGDGVVNGHVDTNKDGVVDAYNPPGTDPDDVPYISVNILRKGYAKPRPGPWPVALLFRPYIMVTAGTSRVAVLGYTTDDSAILTKETEPLIQVFETAWADKDNGVPMTDVITLKEWVEYLRKPQSQEGEGADVVILLSHIGHRRLSSDGDVGDGDGNDELLGDNGDVRPPDLVVSGHWHTWASTAWQPNTLNYKTTIVEAASYAQYVGEVTLSSGGRFIRAEQHPIRVSDFAFPNPDKDIDNTYNAINKLIANLMTEYNNLTGPDCVIDAAAIQLQFPGYVDGTPCPLDYVVGYSAVDLTLDKDKWFTLSEFPWSGDNNAGGWICNAMVDKVRNLNINGRGAGPDNAHLAIQSGGGIRRDIAAGPITYMDIFEAYPWDDDAMVRVQMSSQDIWNYIQGHYVGSSLSEGWQVTAEDGIISSIMYDSDQNSSYNTPLSKTDTTTLWNVIISEYMYQHDDWINETGGKNDSFAQIDTTPEYISMDGSTRGGPISVNPAQIRDSVVEYTARFQSGNPMTMNGSRYILNTEVAGEFNAVVTMTADAENQPYFEAVFVRLLSASPETLRRRNLPGDPYGLMDLVNDDGSIDPDHAFAETLLYRSHLGFPDGYLKVGDTLMIKGEFGFFSGNAQFIDQEGIMDAEEEFDILMHDASAAAPDYYASTEDFFVDEKENHIVKFYARRTSRNTVKDSKGVSHTIYREGGYYSNSTYLPGANGDCLELIGVQTERTDTAKHIRRFRLREASANPFENGSCFPPDSNVSSITGNYETGNTLTINTIYKDLNGYSAGTASGGSQLYGTVTSMEFFVSTSGGESFTSIGVDNTADDGFYIDYIPTSPGNYQFYTAATDDDGLTEPCPVYADITIAVSGPPISKPARRVPILYCGLLLILIVILVIVCRLTRSLHR